MKHLFLVILSLLILGAEEIAQCGWLRQPPDSRSYDNINVSEIVLVNNRYVGVVQKINREDVRSITYDVNVIVSRSFENGENTDVEKQQTLLRVSRANIVKMVYTSKGPNEYNLGDIVLRTGYRNNREGVSSFAKIVSLFENGMIEFIPVVWSDGSFVVTDGKKTVDVSTDFGVFRQILNLEPGLLYKFSAGLEIGDHFSDRNGKDLGQLLFLFMRNPTEHMRIMPRFTKGPIVLAYFNSDLNDRGEVSPNAMRSINDLHLVAKDNEDLICNEILARAHR